MSRTWITGYNDLSPSNILLHFPPMDKTKIFLGVCDWRMACRISEVVASNYGFQASMKWRGNKNYSDMLHWSYFMFLGHVDQH